LYCTQYVTTAANLASYLDWDRERLRAALSKGVGAPVTVIYGDRDEHVDQAWLAGLGAHGVGLRPVAGANHFFDLEHEFDLLDEVLELISGARHG
jgi:pimeloyl-ACP methyl ester carboxylesterase